MQILSTFTPPVYLACLASRAKRVVQVGSTDPRHTLELARAVHQTTAGRGGLVVCADLDTDALDAVRDELQGDDLEDYLLALRGDARCTLQGFAGPIDFLLLDCPADVAGSMLEILQPSLVPGAMVLRVRDHRQPSAPLRLVAPRMRALAAAR